MKNSKPVIGIVGTGYVGLVSGACFADLGFRVICRDVIPEKVDMINNGIPPIFENGLKDLLNQLLQKNRIKATLDINELVHNSDIIFICTGTPSNEDGSIDLRYIESAATDIAQHLKDVTDFKTIVVKSTVVPGTTTDFVLPILEKVSGKIASKDFGLAMNPEFLKEGLAIEDFKRPDRVVIGSIDEISFSNVAKLYQSFSCPIMSVSPSTAEMIKYASNTFLATKISFINEIANMAEKMQLDIDEVAQGMGLDTRISPKFLSPGFGWGGSCFGKDILALKSCANKFGLETKMLNATFAVNEVQPYRGLDLLEKHMEIKDKKIAFLGMAFKPETDDMRDSRAIILAEALLKKGASVVGYDPIAKETARKAMPKGTTFAETAQEALIDSDAAILITEWQEFKDYGPEEFSKMKGKIIIDGRRYLDWKKLSDKGFTISILGSP